MSISVFLLQFWGVWMFGFEDGACAAFAVVRPRAGAACLVETGKRVGGFAPHGRLGVG
jgi:hypothetical protein